MTIIIIELYYMYGSIDMSAYMTLYIIVKNRRFA